MRFKIRLILVFTMFSLFSISAGAAVTNGSHGLVQSLRIEAYAGFIGLSQSLAGSSTCGSRVWVDMRTDLGRAAYATAMMAFSTGKNAIIRADDNSTLRLFGECQLYDIYVVAP